MIYTLCWKTQAYLWLVWSGITHVLQKYEQILIQSIEHLTVEVQGSSEEKGLVKQDT